MGSVHGWTRRRETTVDQTLMRGLVPHDLGFVLGLPHSRDERRSGDRLITAREGSPPRPCPQPCAPPTLCPAAPPHRFWPRWWSALDQTSAGCARRAIAHMKPTISRAIAVVTTTFGLPVAAM